MITKYTSQRGVYVCIPLLRSVQNSMWCTVIILHSARRMVKSYYTTTCTNVYTRALSPEETQESVKVLETEHMIQMCMAHKLVSG